MNRAALAILLLPLPGLLPAQTIDTPPSTPTGLLATAYSSTAGAIAWQRSDDDGQVIGYEITRDGLPLGTLDTLSVVEFDLSPNTLYRYGIAAVDNRGQRSNTIFVELTTRPGAAEIGPSTPYNLTASVYSSTAAELFWDRPDTAVAHYEILRDGALVATTNGVNYFTASLDAGTRYTYDVIAVDHQGARSEPATTALTTRDGRIAAQPAPPEGLRARVYSPTAAELFWQRPAEPGLHHEVSRDGTVLTTTTGISHFDATLEPSTQYHFQIVAIDSNGRRSSPASVSLTTRDDGNTPPSNDPPYARPDPAGTTYLARAGHEAARDMIDELVSTGYLALYFDIDDRVHSLMREHAIEFASSNEIVTIKCPDGGQAQGTVSYLSFDVVFDNCLVEGRLLDGGLKSVTDILVFGMGDAQTYSKTFDTLSVDAGSQGALQVSGNSVIRDRRFAENTAACGGAPTLTRTIENSLRESIWNDGEYRFDLQDVAWAQSSEAYPEAVDGQTNCTYVDSLTIDGTVTASSLLFGESTPDVLIEKLATVRRDPREGFGYSGSGSLSARFDDGVELTLTADSAIDGEAQVDVLDNGSAVSYRDDYRFELREELVSH